MKSDKAVDAFFQEHTLRFKKLADAEWQRRYAAADSMEKCTLLVLKRYTDGILKQTLEETSARTIRVPKPPQT